MYGFRPVHIFRERGPKTSFHTEIPDFQVHVYVYVYARFQFDPQNEGSKIINFYVYVCFHRAA